MVNRTFKIQCVPLTYKYSLFFLFLFYCLGLSASRLISINSDRIGWARLLLSNPSGRLLASLATFAILFLDFCFFMVALRSRLFIMSELSGIYIVLIDISL